MLEAKQYGKGKQNCIFFLFLPSKRIRLLFFHIPNQNITNAIELLVGFISIAWVKTVQLLRYENRRKIRNKI